jgi:chaperonin GroES
MVLVKLASEDQATEGGLLLSANVKVKKNEGTVMSVGPGKINQESGVAYDMPLSPGEDVVFGGYGTEINYNGEKCMLIRDDDVLIKCKGKLNLETAEVLRDNVLVYIEKKKEEDAVGGILLAKSTSSKKLPTIGEVIKVGRGRYATNGVIMDMDVEPGDMIKFRNLAGGKVEIDDKDYTVVQMNSILMKF